MKRLETLLQFTILISQIVTNSGCDMEQATIQLGESTYTKTQVRTHIERMLGAGDGHNVPFFKFSDEIVYPCKTYGLLTEQIQKLFQEKFDAVIQHTPLKITDCFGEYDGELRLLFMFVQDLSALKDVETIEPYLRRDNESRADYEKRLEDPIQSYRKVWGFEEDEHHNVKWIGVGVCAAEINDGETIKVIRHHFIRFIFDLITQTEKHGKIIKETLLAGTVAKGDYVDHLYPFDIAYLKAMYSTDIPNGISKKKAARLIADKIWIEFKK